MTEEAQQQATDLTAIKARLKNVLLSLQTVEAVLVVAGEALAQQATQFDPEIALVLMRCASDPLNDEVKELEAIIERIGGSGASTIDAGESDESGHETDTD